MVDGCTPLGTLLRVVIPIAAPGLAVSAIFAFLVSWNEFLFALILSGPASRPSRLSSRGLPRTWARSMERWLLLR